MHIKNINQKGESSLIQTIMVGLLIVAAFFIGMLWTKVQNYEKGSGTANVAGASPTANAPAPPASTIKIEKINSDDWKRGNVNARVALVDYSDLECPFCKRFHTSVLEVMKDYGDKIVWVYRHFPLDQIHSKARNESIAAECAGKLGGSEKFWAYIDKIYEETPANNGLDAALLPTFASQVGLNEAAFKTCLDNQETKDLVKADSDQGAKDGVQGTPGSALYDTKTGETVELGGAVPTDQLKAAIDSFLSSRK